MKNIFFLAVLVSIFSSAQIVKHTAADFKLSPEVTKYEEQEFYYEFGLKKYQLASTRTVYLNKGLVTKVETKSNYFLYMEATNTYNYKNGLLESIYTKTQLSDYTENFVYKNGKIVEKNQDKTPGNKTIYAYDKKGNLSEETVFENNKKVKRIIYSNYISPNSYLKKTIKYHNDVEDETNEQIYVKGLLQSEKNITQYSTLVESYQYDTYGNQIVYKRDDKTYNSSFEYDSKGNVLRSKITQFDFDTQEDINHFTFAKVTYSDGKIAGSTTFDTNYVKRFDTNSASYNVNFSFNAVSAEELTKAMNDLEASLSSGYTIKKSEGNTYTIKDANGEGITNDVNAVRSNYDILVYDILFKKSILLKGFYTDAVKIGEWYKMEELVSPTNMYWIFSDTSEFFVIQNGTLLDKSLYQLVKTQKEDDFIVREAGIDKYIIRDLNSKGFETFYPLEFLND
ncbi:MAG: hypothetical protein A3G95_01475 [Flavobacteria bacterium RIFCSPLOWO2_12_FULL_31_7]|jgi:hypothetical protein|nr:MAG: hypothetical protein A3G95_01475 [Flavobacteria bacterium RIFCSPLOWO2_12_FULL_31_7]